MSKKKKRTDEIFIPLSVKVSHHKCNNIIYGQEKKF